MSSPSTGEIQFPTNWPKWGFVGRAKYLFYLSDKWISPGDYRIYYHPTKSFCWEPGIQATGGRRRPVVPPPSGELAVLAPALGWQLILPDGTEVVARCSWGDLWCAYKVGKKTHLVVLDLYERRVTALFEGPRLEIRSEGILG